MKIFDDNKLYKSKMIEALGKEIKINKEIRSEEDIITELAGFYSKEYDSPEKRKMKKKLLNLRYNGSTYIDYSNHLFSAMSIIITIFIALYAFYTSFLTQNLFSKYQLIMSNVIEISSSSNVNSPELNNKKEEVKKIAQDYDKEFNDFKKMFFENKFSDPLFMYGILIAALIVLDMLVYRYFRIKNAATKAILLLGIDTINDLDEDFKNNSKNTYDEVATTIETEACSKQAKPSSNQTNGNWNVEINMLSIMDVVGAIYKVCKAAKKMFRKKK